MSENIYVRLSMPDMFWEEGRKMHFSVGSVGQKVIHSCSPIRIKYNCSAQSISFTSFWSIRPRNGTDRDPEMHSLPPPKKLDVSFPKSCPRTVSRFRARITNPIGSRERRENPQKVNGKLEQKNRRRMLAFLEYSQN